MEITDQIAELSSNAKHEERNKDPHAYEPFRTRIAHGPQQEIIRSLKMMGGLYGAIVGDAQGVPYEFRTAKELEYVEVGMRPPKGWINTYPKVEPGTFSDDTSLMLCLLDAITRKEQHPDGFEATFRQNMIDWKVDGKFAVNNKVFDIGMTTAHAIEFMQKGKKMPYSRTLLSNGSLMRTLPIAFRVKPDIDWVEQIHRYMSHVHETNPNELSHAVCMVYTCVAFLMLNYGMDPITALKQALDVTSNWVDREYMDTIVNHERIGKLTGSGYVVDAFWSAFYSLVKTSDFESCIRYAIKYGNDTDTTAMIAGGLAGIKYGYTGIPMDSVSLVRSMFDFKPYEDMVDSMM